MRDKTIDFAAQVGDGVKAICDAIQGLKAWKREYKKQTGMDIDNINTGILTASSFKDCEKVDNKFENPELMEANEQ